MSEHEHHHKNPEEAAGAVYYKGAGTPPWFVVAGTILLSTVIFSASMIYSASIIAGNKMLLSQGTDQAPAAQAPQAPAAPAQQPSAAPVAVTDRSGAPALGKDGAKVTVIEFADFQCPFCKNFFQQTFNQIKTKYIDTGKIKYVFRHFPLTQIHTNAEISGIAGECANQQGKFWDYHSILYTSGQGDGTGLDKASLEKYGDQLGLNKGTLGFAKNKFNQCLESEATKSIVDADQKVGTAAGVSGTPTFFINGTKIVGAQPFSAFEQAIDAALK